MSINFHDWLKENSKLPEEAFEIREKNTKTHNYMYLGSVGIGNFPILVSKSETGKLIQMENYVKDFATVEDEEFDVMLQDKRLRGYKKLADEYVPVDGGIASDLRNDGWRSVAHYLAYKRTLAKEEKKLTTLNITGQVLFKGKEQ